MGGYAGAKLTNLFANPAQTKLRTCCAEIYFARSRKGRVLRLRGRRPILRIPSAIRPDKVHVRFGCINGLPRSAVPKGLRQISCILYVLFKVHSGCCNCVAVTDLGLWGTIALGPPTSVWGERERLTVQAPAQRLQFRRCLSPRDHLSLCQRSHRKAAEG